MFGTAEKCWFVYFNREESSDSFDLLRHYVLTDCLNSNICRDDIEGD